MNRSLLGVSLAFLFLAGCAGISETAHKLYLIICKPSTEQLATAQTQVEHYLTSVERGNRAAAKHRYIAVKTLNPTTKQRLVYVTKKTNAQIEAEKNGEKLSSTWVETPQLKCLMVFDTDAKQFVGAGCYVLGSLPTPGQVAQFESVVAEYVGNL
jgi:hypothetical protein